MTNKHGALPRELSQIDFDLLSLVLLAACPARCMPYGSKTILVDPLAQGSTTYCSVDPKSFAVEHRGVSLIFQFANRQVKMAHALPRWQEPLIPMLDASRFASENRMQLVELLTRYCS